MPRQGDLDGRGNLSRRALAEFTAWFPRVCLDQVTFMDSLFALDRLADRLKLYVVNRALRRKRQPIPTFSGVAVGCDSAGSHFEGRCENGRVLIRGS